MAALLVRMADDRRDLRSLPAVEDRFNYIGGEQRPAQETRHVGEWPYLRNLP